MNTARNRIGIHLWEKLETGLSEKEWDRSVHGGISMNSEHLFPVAGSSRKNRKVELGQPAVPRVCEAAGRRRRNVRDSLHGNEFLRGDQGIQGFREEIWITGGGHM